MPLNLNETMAEVTRLTRAGRLTEAMGLLKGDATFTTRAAPAEPEAKSAGPATGFAGRLLPVDLFPIGRPNLVTKALKGLGALGGRLQLDRLEESESIPSGAEFLEHSYRNAAGSRGYKLYVPAESEDAPRPLIVMLHGCTQSPDDFAAGTQMNALAHEFGFLVAYPAQSSSANSSRCWNWFNDGEQMRGAGEPSLIAGITRQVMAEHAVDPARVYVAGLSAGGAAASIMGSAYPDLYAAIGVHSGLACGAARDMSSAFMAMRQGGSALERAKWPLPTIVFHGDQDSTVHPINGDQVITQSKAAGQYTQTIERGRSPGGVGFTRTLETDADGSPMLEHWALHGSGHAWSGGNSAGSFTDPRGPDASREMVRFFLQHPKMQAGGDAA